MALPFPMLAFPPNLRSVETRLRAAGIHFEQIEEVSAKAIREVNHRNFPDMRSIDLSARDIRIASIQPLLRDLFVSRIGYHGSSAGHYMPRPKGSTDHILIFSVSGEGWLRIAGQDRIISSGTMFCLPAGVPHWYGSSEEKPWSIYWVYFSGRQAADYFQWLGVQAAHPLLHISQREVFLEAFKEIWQCMKAVHTYDNLVQGSVALIHFLGILRRMAGVSEVRQKGLEESVQETIDFVNRNLSAELSVPEMAQLAHLSVSRYTSTFRRITGCAPMEYFNRLRIQQACELLRTTDFSVQEIGRQVGFHDPYYFSRAFKKIKGESPSEFRKK